MTSDHDLGKIMYDLLFLVDEWVVDAGVRNI